MRIYEVRPRKDRRGFDLISEALPFGRLWYAEPNAVSNAVGYAKFFSRSHDAVVRVYDATGDARYGAYCSSQGGTPFPGQKSFPGGGELIRNAIPPTKAV